MQKFAYSLLVFLFAIGSTALNAQTPTPTPAAEQSVPVVISGGTIHIGNGETIENGYIRFENGEITELGEQKDFETPTAEKVKIIEAAGKHIYPGLIAPNTVLGLREIGAVRATRDDREVGAYNANVRAIIAYNTDSRVIPTVRSNGILLAQITPRGGRISGTSALVQLDAWNWEDAAIKQDDGLFINWPSSFVYKGWWGDPQGYEKNKKYDEQVKNLETFLTEAKAYAQKDNPEKTNLKFEALREVFSKNQSLYVKANKATELMQVIDLAERLDVKIVLVGASESWQIAELLAEKQIPVILGTTHDLPSQEDSDIDQPFKTPAILEEKGVLFCLSFGGFWEERNLPFMAGTAVAYGLEKEAAIQMITLNTAKIMGIDDQYGSLEKGKSATLIISEGDVMDMRTSIIENAFIDGREIDLSNKQKALYERYKEKYELED